MTPEKNESPNKKKSANKKMREEFEDDKKFMDEPPLEDLKEQMKDERDKLKSKNTSQSERKHKSGRDNK